MAKADDPDKEAFRIGPKELEKINEWFEKFGDKAMCHTCDVKLTGVMEYMVAMPVFHLSKGTMFGPVYPFFMVVCEKCGFTHFVNAVTAGVVPRENEEGAAND